MVKRRQPTHNAAPRYPLIPADRHTEVEVKDGAGLLRHKQQIARKAIALGSSLEGDYSHLRQNEENGVRKVACLKTFALVWTQVQ